VSQKCRSCGAAIQWAITEAGKKMPLDYVPDPNGRVVFVDRERVRVLGAEELTTAQRYTSHFATCPHAGEHRRRR
jgi:hypothetical protein